jgi:hypothetical protein
MYSEYPIEVQNDYPAGVALRLNRKRVAFESQGESLKLKFGSRWQDPGNETIQGSLADPGEAKI